MAAKKVGRPTKKEAVLKAEGMSRRERSKAMQLYASRILEDGNNVEKAIQTVFRHALDDDSPKQTMAWKLLFDRIAPAGNFTVDGKAKSPSVAINITGLSSPGVAAAPASADEGAIEADFRPISDEAD